MNAWAYAEELPVPWPLMVDSCSGPSKFLLFQDIVVVEPLRRSKGV
jgi:hypothetical protein